MNRRWGLALVVLLAVSASGCGEDESVTEARKSSTTGRSATTGGRTVTLREVCAEAVDTRDEFRRSSGNVSGYTAAMRKLADVAADGPNSTIENLAESAATLSASLEERRGTLTQDQIMRDVFSMLTSIGRIFDECEAEGVIVPGMPTEANEEIPVPEDG